MVLTILEGTPTATLSTATRGVFVNPALQEPFGLTLIEAAAHGAPIVATCNGGPVDIVKTLSNGEGGRRNRRRGMLLLLLRAEGALALRLFAAVERPRGN